MVISQVETALRYTSFIGSLNNSQAGFESSGSLVMNHRKVHVSRSIFICFAVKGTKNFGGQRLIKLRRNLKLTLCQANRARRLPVRGEGSDFSNRNIPFAQKDGFPLGQPLKVAREMGFCFMDVKSNHESIIA